MKQLYISDLDGTLLNNKGTLSHRSEVLLKELLENELPFTVASGRTPITSLVLLDALPLTLPMILLNGALIYDPVTDRALETTPMSASQKDMIQTLGSDLGLSGFQTWTNASVLCYSLSKSNTIWKQFFERNQLVTLKNFCPPNDLSSDPDSTLLYATYTDNCPQRLKKMYQQLLASGTFSLDFYKDLYLPDTWFLEIYSSRATKGNALKKLRKLYDIQHITAFGNGENDLSFFQESDWNCAVENSSTALLEMASQIIPSNQHDGVAKYLEQAFRTDWLFEHLQQETSIVNLTSSIITHHHLPSVNSPCPPFHPAEQFLKKPFRNFALILLDGLGTNVLEQHLPEHSFLRSHFFGNLCSVFPPTTTAAATALETGLYPSQSGYLGWSIYWPSLKKNVHLYQNLADDGTPASPVHLAQTYLYAPLWIRKADACPDITPTYIAKGQDIDAQTLEELADALEQITSSPGKHSIYAYLNEPDHTLHKRGTASAEITTWLCHLDKTMKRLAHTCPDTLFFLTADHGFTDIEPLCLEDYPDLLKMLVLPPSIEPRAMNLFVKKENRKQFLRRFHEVTKNTYRIYTREQILSMKLFGPEPFHPLFPKMLGDFLAVAQTPLTLFPNRSYMESMVAGHGGLTAQEIYVPFISWEGSTK